jgi:hypothetical protein
MNFCCYLRQSYKKSPKSFGCFLQKNKNYQSLQNLSFDCYLLNCKKNLKSYGCYLLNCKKNLKNCGLNYLKNKNYQTLQS